MMPCHVILWNKSHFSQWLLCECRQNTKLVIFSGTSYSPVDKIPNNGDDDQSFNFISNPKINTVQKYLHAMSREYSRSTLITVSSLQVQHTSNESSLFTYGFHAQKTPDTYVNISAFWRLRHFVVAFGRENVVLKVKLVNRYVPFTSVVLWHAWCSDTSQQLIHIILLMINECLLVLMRKHWTF